MATSTSALLPKDRKKDDHPIFLRVCHSPWTAIDQKGLVGLRGLAAAYMLVSFGIIIEYELRHLQHGWLTIFEFSNIQYFLQVLYHVIAFTWTFMHLHYPHHGSQTQTAATRFQRFLSPPRQHATTQNRTYFSIFYSAANTFPFTSSLIHWAVMIPTHKTSIPADQIFSNDWHTSFFVINKWGISALLAFIEVLFLSSIRCPEPVGYHIAGISTLSAIYIAWQYIGYIVADKYAYFFFDHDQVDGKYVVASWFLFTLGNIFFYYFIYGLTAVRQQMTKKSEKRSGYQQLPQ
jgi:hypothetical protein